MKLEYTETGKFVPETHALAERLKADAVVLLVFNSQTHGSGVSCEIRANDPEPLSRAIIEALVDLSYSIEAALASKGSPLAQAKEECRDKDRHQQEKLEHPDGELRCGEPSP